MRSLKKILAMALALAMVMSVTAFAGFTDAKKIDENYAEAVEVLTGMEVIKGYTDGSFRPEGSITRAEVAAIIYRIATQDVEDDKAPLYAGLAKFSDVKAADWFAGYVGYAANAGYIKGYPDGTFKPQGLVTGFEALAMVLRVLGYDAENEFTGITWTDKVAKAGTQAGILEELNADEKLAVAADRELVAQMTFTALNNATAVRYTPAFGYTNTTVKLGDAFELTAVDSTDEWGRPSYGYTYNTGDEETLFAKKPVATYTTAVTECEVAVDAGIKTTKTYDLYVNGVKSSDTIVALDTVDTIGAQGRLTEVYKDRIVMIDTLLAKVTSVVDATYDVRGHLKTESKLTMTVYDGANTVDVMTNGKTNYDYEAGDMVLVNAYTVSGNRDTAGVVSGVYTEILGLADYEVGTQSVIWYNIGKHTINNVTYNDAAEFHLDEADKSTSTYTWFFDQYGNVIGDVEVATQYDYAVLKNIWWAGDVTTGSGAAKATLIYMDGSENVVTLKKIDGHSAAYSTDFDDVMKFYASEKFYVATDAATNAACDNQNNDVIKGHLFRVTNYADGTVALDKVADAQKAHTQLTNPTIMNKYAWIGNVKIDLDTQFLVRGTSEASSFKTYTGMNELPSFKAGAVVDYVLGADGVAEYVYIIGSTIDSSDNAFVLIVDDAYSAVLKTAGGVNYWELTLPVPAEDGSVLTLKTQSEEVLGKLTSVTSVGKLFYVSYTNGYAVAADEITTAIYSYSTNGRAIKLNKTATYEAGVIESGDYRFNVTAATVVIGDLAADMTDKVVYVIYDSRNVVAEKVYVLDINEEITPPATPAPTTGSVYYVVTMLADGQETVVKTATWTGAPGTYGNQNFATTAAAYWPEIVVANWNVLIDGSEVVVEAGQVSIVEYVITF